MPGHDIIVVGASAGGVEALQVLAAGRPVGENNCGSDSVTGEVRITLCRRSSALLWVRV